MSQSYKVVDFSSQGASPARADRNFHHEISAVMSRFGDLMFGEVADVIAHDRTALRPVISGVRWRVRPNTSREAAPIALRQITKKEPS